jgi:ribosomal protein S18 acetylase RimI-like enzyme
MASIPISAQHEAHPHLRPLNILRDLPAVADLIELCFSDTMDRDGQRYVQDMRRAGRDDKFLRWATRMAESTSLPLTGYVWERDGKLVGNASLVPFRHKGARIYLIANVAVHPDYRRAGIGRSLTQKALEHARERRASAIWLHVRDDNPGAIKLYAELGFRERARRTSWQARGDFSAGYNTPGMAVTDRPPQHWPQQHTWLQRAYPDDLGWYRPWSFSALRPGLWNWLYGTLMDLNPRQWSALWGPAQQLEAVLAWIPAGAESNGLWLAAPANPKADAVTALLIHARHALGRYPSISMEYPGGEAEEAMRAAGFNPLRTLIWMQHTGETSRPEKRIY